MAAVSRPTPHMLSESTRMREPSSGYAGTVVLIQNSSSCAQLPPQERVGCRANEWYSMVCMYVLVSGAGSAWAGARVSCTRGVRTSAV